MSLASSHEAEALAERALDPPGQVTRVDRQAVAAYARPRRERHEPERLGRCGVDRLPDVNAQIVGEHRELVNQGDVDMPEGVLDDLGELGDGRGGYRDALVDDSRVEGLHGCEPAGHRFPTRSSGSR